jgi:hypothetical protein
MTPLILLLALTPITEPLSAPLTPCQGFGELAANIMQARQRSVPIADLLDAVDGNAPATVLVLQAYSYRVGDPLAVSRFRDEAVETCITLSNRPIP